MVCCYLSFLSTSIHTLIERFMPNADEGPSADEVADALEKMPYVWQHFDEPPAGMMTT